MKSFNRSAMRVIEIGVALSALFCAIFIFGTGMDRIDNIISYRPAMVIFGFTAGYMVIAFSLKDILRSFRYVVTGNSVEIKEVIRAAEIFGGAHCAALTGGVASSVFWIIWLLLVGYDNPIWEQFLVAQAFKPLLCALLASGLFYALKCRCRAALGSSASDAVA